MHADKFHKSQKLLKFHNPRKFHKLLKFHKPCKLHKLPKFYQPHKVYQCHRLHKWWVKMLPKMLLPADKTNSR